MKHYLMNQFGLYYVGSLLTLVGYDPNFTVDDRRFWIRNTKEWKRCYWPLCRWC